MEKSEYDIRVKEINDQAEKLKKALNSEYIRMYPNLYKIGDIIKHESFHYSIKIDKITYSIPYAEKHPEPNYQGPLVKADGTPYKSGKRENILHSRVVNKEETVK